MSQGKSVYENIKEKILSNPYQTGFILMACIFLTMQVSVDTISSAFTILEPYGMLNVLLFFAYSFLFLISNGKYSKRSKAFLLAAFVTSVLELGIVMFGLGYVSSSMLFSSILYIFPVFYYLPLLLFGFFLISVSILLMQSKYRLFAYAFLVFAIISSVVLYHVINQNITFIPSDEIFISYAQIQPFLHGMDPYTNNVGSVLYSNSTVGKVGELTYTTLNQIEGTLDYPALYFLVSIPFYLTKWQVLQGMGYAIKIEIEVFLAILLLVLVFTMDKKYLQRPAYGLVLILSFFLIIFSTPTEFIMLAILILAYVKLESRYSWVLLGLCASFQELLWLPVGLLLLYTFNNYGFKKGLYSTIGSVIVFILVNSYFIAINPGAFVNSVLVPINNILTPSSSAPFSYLINILYGTSLKIDGLIFGTVCILMALVFLYFNNKKLVGILSFIPLLFTLHANMEIFGSFFITFTVAILFITEGKEKVKPIWSNWLRQQRTLFFFSFATIVLLVLLAVFNSHLAYEKNFNLSITNQQVYLNPNTSTLTYSGTLNYRHLANDTVYAKVFVPSNDFVVGDSIFATNPSLYCNNLSGICKVNVGELQLNGSDSVYHISINVSLEDPNKTYTQQISLYNGQYFYVSSLSATPK